ncbi:MAG: 2-C-methyl-D-erythritol 2,4-cyclodiphosphate synthase [Elusimicrobiota bacterium]|nr:2-C-methyl-D-erythritol 2,4-cyclodiphosphate synthase [Elusimicrobiota bacterium]
MTDKNQKSAKQKLEVSANQNKSKGAQMFIGIGYDAHRFKKGRKLFLGGVEIESAAGLDGHSDADVLIHALMDALLGAAGLDDIGHFFPNTDEKYKGISSLELLKIVCRKLQKKKFAVHNADITVIAQTPKIAPYIEEMKDKISKILKIKKERLSIKATTNEKMGFIGRNEGIAALSAASIKKANNLPPQLKNRVKK